MVTHSVRYLQFEGALCLAAFCTHFGIRHNDIAEKISHQLALLQCDSLPDWCDKVSQLQLTGLGDPLPKDFVIPQALKKDFLELLNFSTEIGVVDMYSMQSDRPSRYLRDCRKSLRRNCVVLPVGVIHSAIEVLPWGEPLSRDEIEKLVSLHAAVLEPYLT